MKKFFIFLFTCLSLMAFVSGDWVRPSAGEASITAHANLYYHQEIANLTVVVTDTINYFNITGLAEYNTENMLTDNSSNIYASYDGQYYLSAVLSFLDTTNNNHEIAMFKNNAEIEEGCEVYEGTGNGILFDSATVICNVELLAGDYVNVRIQDETPPATNVKIRTMNFHAHRIGGFTSSSGTLDAIYLRTDGSNNMTGQLNVIDKAYIKSNLTVAERIGIGTSTPNSLLELYSAVPIMTFTSTNAFSGATINVKGLNQDTDQLFKIQDEGTNRLAILRDGRVGIGTITPTFNFEIIKTAPSMMLDASGATTGQGSIWMDADRAGDGAISGYWSIYNNGATPITQLIGYRGSTDIKGDLVLKTSDVERMRIDEDGFVSIGTISPLSKLHLSGTGAGQASIRLQYTAGGGRTFQINPYRTGVSNGGFEIYDVTGGTAVLSIDSSQNLGIGTGSPSYPLHVAKNVSGIAARFEGNITVDDVITFTTAYKDKSGGTKKALDYVKDSSAYYNADGTINHDAFEYSKTFTKKNVTIGYEVVGVNYYNVTKTTITPITVFNQTTNTTQIFFNETTTIEFYNETLTKPTQIEINKTGVSTGARIALLEQQMYELITALCNDKPNTYDFCN